MTQAYLVRLGSAGHLSPQELVHGADYGGGDTHIMEDQSRSNDSWSEATDRFLDYCRHERGFSGHTQKAYGLDLEHFRRERQITSDTPVGRVLSKESVRAFLQSIEGSRPKTIRRKAATLKSFCRFLEIDDSSFKNPFLDLRIRIKVERSLPRGIAFSEVKTLLHHARAQVETVSSTQRKNVATRDLAVLELLFSTGMRVSELSHLKESNIDFEGRQLRVMGKGARERILPFGFQAVYDAVRAYVEIRPRTGGEEFFLNRTGKRLSEQSIRFMLRRVAKGARLRKITPHMLRHSVATLLLEQEFDIRYLQHFLGHSSITTTTIYASVSNEAHRRLLTAKHPRRLMDAVPNTG